MGEIACHKRILYWSLCGGPPPHRNESGDLTDREKTEVDMVSMAIVKHPWFLQFASRWKRLPTTEDGVVVVNLSKGEKYVTPESFVGAAVERIWKAIGTPVIEQDGGVFSYRMEGGVWPYLTGSESLDEQDVLEVQDRLIDIVHVCSLIEDEFADLLKYFWGQRAFHIIKMVRDFVDYLNDHALDDTGRTKMNLIKEELCPLSPASEPYHIIKKESEADNNVQILEETE